MTDPTKPETNMQKFRKVNRRIDFYPTSDALAAIERLRQSRPGESTRMLIDRLVIAGIKTYFPETPPLLSGKNQDGMPSSAGVLHLQEMSRSAIE